MLNYSVAELRITRILYEIIFALCSSCQEETLLINNEYMTIGQAKAEPYWFALCLTDLIRKSKLFSSFLLPLHRFFENNLCFA